MNSSVDTQSSAYLSQITQSLNPEQKKAVETLNGPVLVLAGAGTGKTKVLTSRIAYILATKKAQSDEILGVTFTNKAAKEMQERVKNLIQFQAGGLPWLGTFHAISSKLLRKYGNFIGIKSNFVILDKDDQLNLIKKILKKNSIDEDLLSAKFFQSYVDKCKNNAEEIKINNITLKGKEELVKNIYTQYNNELRNINSVDFGDLIILCLEIFKKSDKVRKYLQSNFKYILVDEYQDINSAQYKWLRAFSAMNQNICCVGDEDQSIYSWRGAKIKNILNFQKDYKKSKIIRLEQNYRSTSNILNVASKLISYNKQRIGKNLWTDQSGGQKVKILGTLDTYDEVNSICKNITLLKDNHTKYSNIAILIRAIHQSRPFEERLIKEGIPYKIVGGAKFYDRLEIKDIIAYLRLLSEPNFDLAFERIINKPKRGLGPSSLQKIENFAKIKNTSFLEASKFLVKENTFSKKQIKELSSFLDMYERWYGLKNNFSLSKLVEVILNESGYMDSLSSEDTQESITRIDNLKELVSTVDNYENLDSFLEHIALVTSIDEQSKGEEINIITMHSAKGLEFNHVFLPGWEEGLFPHQRTIEESPTEGVEEERRLAYVGLTRAMVSATITYTARRKIHNQWHNALPSRFIDEIPKEEVEFTEPQTNNYEIAQEPIYSDSDFNQDSMSDFSNIEDSNLKTLALGQQVHHEKFGHGTVRKIEGDKVTVKFRKAGVKKLMSLYLSKI